MDFLRNRATLAGRDTREERNIRDLANHGIRQEGKGPPYANPFQSTKSRQTLKIRQTARPPPTPTLQNPPNHGVPSQSFLIQIPYGQTAQRLEYVHALSGMSFKAR